MSRIWNFSAGPAALPQAVLERARDEMLDFHGTGMSVMEMSHRGKPFMEVAEKAEADLRKLMGIPDDYAVLFLQGGATGQFSAIPMNLQPGGQPMDYIDTGAWSGKAIKEAQKVGPVNIVASSQAEGYASIPERSTWKLDPNAAYVHYTPNETIGGVEFHEVPDVGDKPLVADMSSTILSRPIDVSKFGVIYAGAQKNIGPAGVTVVIVRKDLLEREKGQVPAVLDWKLQADNDSMYNTPPTFGWYFAGLVFEWLLEQGGLEKMAEINQRKADKLYRFIDNSAFYRNPVEPSARSWMNVPFILADDSLDGPFLKEADAAGLSSLKGHRSVGGMRASIYNAVPEEAVDALIEFMADFEERHA
ncbi:MULTISPECIES: 3-phosphoserine/phosphohydroxythreonine transaminase [Thioalkalivibrio]|uniref:Phosphoserine aminotransferase n=1 Tax=Thioalkalivibrio halophilus TaxID=252474 RepID=A0A1V3A225_9GAMM|nr:MULTISPECIES: 3-phosphoserine/phosphohydroxythreonine transaminase [Thioalkalivibrio]OOC11386.1 3-phosphoserine/phosphohydroxythreonine aminotransferase [Thioalkalivibrio halophilus]PYG04036.1 phosphoserine aminotransferase [Thioalkalivibrio sp. ALE21]